MENTYTKLLVARYSPANKCNIPDDEVVYILPRALPTEVTGRSQILDAYFVGVNDRKRKAKYAWVKDVSPFTVNEFVTKYIPKDTLTQDIYESACTMLNRIAQYDEGTPVAAHYNAVGVMNKQYRLFVHKVGFYAK